MKSEKLFEISEDDERFYLSFHKQRSKVIFGLPKNTCEDRNYYAGVEDSKLNPISIDDAKELISKGMLSIVERHPIYSQLCSKSIKGLLG